MVVRMLFRTVAGFANGAHLEWLPFTTNA
jgi:hypothetical protein